MTYLEKAMEMDFEGTKVDKETILDIYCPCSFGLEDDNGCESTDRMKCTECWNREMPDTETKNELVRDFDCELDMAYDRGLNDAWELARKIFALQHEEVHGIFGWLTVESVINNNTYDEALAKLKAYEEAQNKIEVGDIVKLENGRLMWVTLAHNGYMWGLDKDGRVYLDVEIKGCKKTGKHIDISSILEQIGE